ncbi:MAG: hypothetical protein EXR51_04965 [Dehalococcoidia bacterium]|nr:hypothetical protein [Dehalococcoidia bacterium]
MTVTGIILAGGRSTRLGRDKALVLVGGRAMITHVADALRPAHHRDAGGGQGGG